MVLLNVNRTCFINRSAGFCKFEWAIGGGCGREGVKRGEATGQAESWMACKATYKIATNELMSTVLVTF